MGRCILKVGDCAVTQQWDNLASKTEGKVWPLMYIQVEDSGRKIGSNSHLVMLIFFFELWVVMSFDDEWRGKRVTRFCTQSPTSHMRTPSVLDKSGNLVMLRVRKRERLGGGGVLNVDITMEKWERSWPEMQSCWPAQGLRWNWGPWAALCAWLCDFFSNAYACWVVLSGEGVLPHPDMCLEDFCNPNYAVWDVSFWGQENSDRVPRVGSPVRWEILLSVVYNTSLSPCLHTWQMAQWQHFSASWGTSEIWTYVHNTSL